MPKTRFKRFLSMVLTLCMVISMMPTMILPAFAANGMANAVGFNGKDSLSEQYPLLNKDGVKKSGNLSQLDGEDYVAHLDVNTGTLTLWNYTGGTITNGGAGGVKDITVVLKGGNVITSGSLVDSTGGGDITITTDGTNNGSLTINNKKSTTSTIVGIGTGLSGVNNGPGAITIGGKAKITIDVENTGTGEARGISARQGVTIDGDAELNIKAKSTGIPRQHSTSGIFTGQGGIAINTTGKITIDTSGAGEETYSYALYGAPQTTLTNVDTMVLKWTKWGQHGKPIYGTLNYTEANYSIIDESNSKQTITYIKTDLKFTHNSNLDVLGGNGGDAITQIDVNSGVTGGSAPLTFTKISGPPWLNVSEDGKITGTRPTAGQVATTAKIRVTDSRGAWREIEIAVGAVTGNAPVTNVKMGDVVLYNSKPYLVNGQPASSGVLGQSGCTAHLDVATGILSLHGYNSDGILITDGSHDKDLIIDLIGNNTITQTGDGDQYGITRQGALDGNIMVTSSSGGKLTIDVTSDTQAVYGIRSDSGSGSTSGNITISGNANVTIDVEAKKADEFLASAYGINPSDTFSIIDEASLTVTAKSGSADNSSAHGIYTSGDASVENKVYMNTTGEVSLNTSGNTGDVDRNQPLRAQEGFYLDNVSKLTLKWSGDDGGEPTVPAKAEWNWTASDYRFTSGDKTHTYQPAGNFFTGTIVINGEPRVGETLKASLIDTNADPDAIISYRWKVADRPSEDGPTYKVMPADVGLELKISATTGGKAGTIDSDPVTIQKGFGPEAPTLSAQAPSALGASDGKIIGTTNKMEYADNEEFKNATDCTASPTLVKAGTYYVRVKETGTHEAGKIANVTVPQGELTKLPIPNADFLASSDNGGTLSNVTTAMKYSVDGGSTWLDITATSIEITNVTTTHGVKVYQPGDNTTTSDSDVQTLTVHQYDKPENIGKTDCTTEANNDGKLTGLSDGMEYKKNDATSWTEVESTTVITDLTPGTYLVRRMAEDNSLASESVEIVINGYEAIEKNIKSVATIADINVDNGTELASLGLPTTVEVTLEDDSTQSLAVSWDNGNPTYAKDTAGDYVFTGTLTLVSGITNTADIKASVKVIVAEVPIEKYSVTYDGNGNTSGDIPKDNKEYSSGQEVTVLNDGNIIKTNYIFDGWNTKADGTGTDYAEGEKFNITENITLYAKWILEITKIEIKTSPTKTEYADQDKLDLTGLVVTVTYADTTTKDIGFSDFEKNHLTTSFAHDMPITKTENKTLNVHWDKNNDVFANIEAYKVYYRITFDAQGGTVSPASALTKGNSEGIILGEGNLPTPTRDGHTFNGWFSQSTGGDKIEADTQFNQNTTIYAQWTKDIIPPENYTVTVQNDGNGTGTASPSTAVAGTEINLTATANTGYKLKEWQVISGGVTITSNKFTMPDNNVVIKAIFEEMDIPVDKSTLTAAISSANTNKGTAVVSTDGIDIDPSDKWVTQAEMDAYTDAISTAQAVADKTDASQTEVDNAVAALNTATNTFNNAKKAGNKITIEITGVTISPKSTTVEKGTTAQFTASVTGTGSYDKTVTWSVYGNNDTNTTINSSGLLTVDAGETATSLTVTATSNGNSSISDDATVTVSDIPITTYTVTVNSGSGSGDYPAGATVSITAGSPPVGQEFDRWISSDVTLSNENATTTTFEMPANDVTITATYKDLPLTEYTVTVQDDGNGTGSAYPSTAVAGTEINLTATADTGYKFKAWQVISGGVTIVGNKFTMPDNDVVVKAVFEKEEITPPVTTYTVTVNGSYASTTGGGKYAKDTTVTIHAGSRSNYSFNGWTSSDGISFANANSATTSFTMPDKPVTIIANWSYTGGGGSSGGSSSGGSTSPTKPTIPTADGTVKVEYSTSNGTASLLISNTKANEIIAKAKNREAVLDLESVKNITGVNIPKNALSSFEKADLDLVVKLPEGTATINNEALASILDQSTGTADMKIELKEVTTNSLSLVQKESVRKDDLVFDINILMGSKKITEFDGKLTINVPYDGELPVAVWYLNDKGQLEKLESRYRNGLVSFTLNHLSLYVVGKDKIEEEIELETKWINPFTDVKEDSWFYEAVKYVYENDLMKGTGGNQFSPNEATTRGMIVTILHRLEGSPLAKQGSFTDVKADKYYANAVTWAAENKIVNGYGKDKFGPEDPITREQLAAILMNYAKYKGYDVSVKADLGKYEDSKGISNWARDAMSWANAEGLIQGDGNKLIPTGNATRAQVAAILSRFVDKIIK